jgi:outer membrane protein assembly factor BamB
MVVDGKVYMPTSKGLWVLAAGKDLKILAHITLGGKVYASPIVANGTLYVATNAGWLWAVSQR